jgi:plastocyanin
VGASTSATSDMTGTRPVWRGVGRSAALLAVVGHLIVGAALRDMDAVFIAIAFAVAVGLTRLRGGTLGWALLALVFANVTFWTVAATVGNLAGTAATAGTLVAASAATLCGVGLIASVAVLLHRDGRVGGGRGARWTVVSGATVLVVLTAATVISDGSDPVVAGGAVEVRMDRTAFEPEDLAIPAGRTTFLVENHDYFWHTFTVDDLGIDIRVPVGGTKTIEVEVPAGRYEVICAIPGHDRAGMTATLVAGGAEGG